MFTIYLADIITQVATYSLYEGFLTSNSAAVYLKSGLETPHTNVNLDN